MDSKSETRQMLKNDKFILQVVNEIKKKIKPLTRSKSIFKNKSLKINDLKICSESSCKKSEEKVKSIKQSNQLLRRSTNSLKSQSNYESLQRKVHDHIVMRRLHLLQNSIIPNQRESIEESNQQTPIMDYLKKIQRGEKQTTSQYEINKNKTFLKPKFKNYRVNKVNTYSYQPENRTMSQLQRRLKKLIQRDILEQYKKQKMTKIMLSINHRKMISLN